MIELHNIDCMEAMKQMPDKAFDLAIVDPPYGIGTCQEYGNTRGIPKSYPKKEWDSDIPKAEYWAELFRVAKNQIVFGGNYMTKFLPVSRGWIYWRKLAGGNYSDGELAWTSFDTVLREFTKRTDQGNRFHPTQKPVKLYEWILNNYASPGQRILDTHGGSFSLAIACDTMGYDFTGYEIDAEYYEAAKKRLEEHKRQGKMVFV